MFSKKMRELLKTFFFFPLFWHLRIIIFTCSLFVGGGVKYTTCLSFYLSFIFRILTPFRFYGFEILWSRVTKTILLIVNERKFFSLSPPSKKKTPVGRPDNKTWDFPQFNNFPNKKFYNSSNWEWDIIDKNIFFTQIIWESIFYNSN